MSPVQQTRLSPRTVIIMAVSAVIVAGGLLLFVLVSLPQLRSTGEVEVQLGSDTFDAGFATVQAEAIATRGPILYPDLAGGQRDIFLQHVGDDPLTGWFAFDARRPGTGRECTLVWDVDAAAFADPCDGATIPADGTGLQAFVVEVQPGEEAGAERVVVDLNAESTPPGTTSG